MAAAGTDFFKGPELFAFDGSKIIVATIAMEKVAIINECIFFIVEAYFVLRKIFLQKQIYKKNNKNVPVRVKYMELSIFFGVRLLVEIARHIRPKIFV